MSKIYFSLSTYGLEINVIITIQNNMVITVMESKLLRPIAIFYSVIFLLSFFGVFSTIAPAENLIKRETLSYERCLEVIDTIADQILLSPIIISDTANVRKAEFNLTDGKLLVTCDKGKEEVRITSK